ncbi:MAG: hypothetical protein A3F76_02620 [Burkholderiales bacterium RIFCSPLOWO2_12_FULL_65_40]|nr:MAG: hypothetical protein A2Z55_05820 [Burkholderiales bacterium RIFCSPHIGHO2_12_63_9]OGB48716.1 MAG: hypothetical protein A3F76_02620 [Burkholderiales bacterium RIFCSPLOWO2_12_FULL_65_40]
MFKPTLAGVQFPAMEKKLLDAMWLVAWIQGRFITSMAKKSTKLKSTTVMVEKSRFLGPIEALRWVQILAETRSTSMQVILQARRVSPVR